MLLADHHGKITDYNLVALNTFKEVFKVDEGFLDAASLQEIGLQDWNSSLFRKQNGSLGVLAVRAVEKECLVVVEPVAGSMSR